jgi:hypothetical protein
LKEFVGAMKSNKFRAFLIFGLIAFLTSNACSDGLVPEKIFQNVIDWNEAVGIWEILPEDNPLAESRTEIKQAERALMTLRKDGTCRVIDKESPTGADGLWAHDDHGFQITFRQGTRKDFFVYGIKWDFMITRSPAKDGTDQLWSRVK